MPETVYIDAREMRRMTVAQHAQLLLERVEAATCKLMCRMWAAELYTVDGWMIVRVTDQRSGYERPDIINLRPFNKVTRSFYQESNHEKR